MQNFQEGFLEITQVNKKLYEKLDEMSKLPTLPINSHPA
jgi:hypothetical protein